MEQAVCNTAPVEKLVPELVKKGEFLGITGDLSSEEYHRAPGLNFSALKAFASTPAEYQAYLRTQKEPTDDQRLGSLVHMRVLEPVQFDRLVVPVDGVWRDKVKEKVAELRKDGFFPAKSPEIEKAKVMADSVLSHPQVRNLLKTGYPEQSIFWKERVKVQGEDGEEEVDILCKCRPDWLRMEDGILMDLKWFNDLNERAVMKQIYRQKYHWQSAWYLHGAGKPLMRKLNMFVHVFIQEKDPYLVRTMALHDAALERAEEEYQPLLSKFAQCQRLNYWPGYPERVETITLPDFAWTDWS